MRKLTRSGDVMARRAASRQAEEQTTRQQENTEAAVEDHEPLPARTLHEVLIYGG